jgi:hypothetical protein
MGNWAGFDFLFSGYLLPKGKDIALPKGDRLDPVKNQIVFGRAPRKKDQKDTLGAFITDDSGLLYHLIPPFGCGLRVRSVATEMQLQIVPANMIHHAFSIHGKNWARNLADALSLASQTKVMRWKIFGHQLREPIEVDGKKYKQLYDKLNKNKDAFIFGGVLVKTRAIIFLLSEKFRGSRIDVWLPGGDPTNGDPFYKTVDPRLSDGLMCAVLRGGRQKLRDGIYTLRVNETKKAINDEHCRSRIIRVENAYTLKQNVKFQITNVAGEFDIVIADPISVEESFLLQFPNLYGDLIKAGSQKATEPVLDRGEDFGEIPVPLRSWVKNLSWTRARAKGAVKILKADSSNAFFYQMGKVLYEFVPKEEGAPDAARSALELGFGLKESTEQWGKVKRAWLKKVTRESLNVSKKQWGDLASSLQTTQYWKYDDAIDLLKKQYGAAPFVAKLDGLSAEQKEVFEKIVTQGRRPRSRKISAGKIVKKGFAALGTAESFFDLGFSVMDVVAAKNKVGTNQGYFDDVCREYSKKIGACACREGLGLLEKYRGATVAGQMEVEEKTAASMNKAVDTALGVLRLIPATALAANLIAVGKDVIGAVLELMDALLDGSWRQERVALQEWIMEASATNLGLMPKVGNDDGQDDLHLQFRLRAEALHGLLTLLTRAAVAFSLKGLSPKQAISCYQSKVDKYKVREYIADVLLCDGWQFPKQPTVSIPLASWWLYTRSDQGELEDEERWQRAFGYSEPLVFRPTDRLPGGMLMMGIMDRVPEDNIKSNFHKYFPIHYREAKSIEDFALAFKPDYSELDRECIEFTCVYYRRHQEGPTAKWRRLVDREVEDVDDLPDLSPLDPVRVLVVLKPDLPRRVYPIYLQLFRTDGLNKSGPVYKDIVRDLDAELLDEERRRWGKKDGRPARLGCVFYPFYQVGPQTVAGVKPMDNIGDDLAVKLHRDEGDYERMRYAFEVRVGGKRSLQWIKLHRGKSDLEDFQLSINRGDVSCDGILSSVVFSSRTKGHRYPPLFVPGWAKKSRPFGPGPCFVRVGGDRQAYQPAWQTLSFGRDKFNWSMPVELVLTAWAYSVNDEAYRKINLDHRSVPISMTLMLHGMIWDDGGPTFDSRLCWLGKMNLSGGKWSLSGSDNRTDRLESLVAELKGGKYCADIFKHYIKDDGRGKRYFYLYAAYFRMRYRLDADRCIDGMPRFGKVDSDGYFQFKIENIRTKDAVGFHAAEILGRDGDQVKLRFQAPAS